MPVFEFAGDGPTSAMSGIRPKVAEWRMMKEAADPTAARPEPSAMHGAESRHRLDAYEIRAALSLSAQPSTSMQPDRIHDDDERRTRRTARATPTGRVPCAA